ncbi:MAG TPA: hypothetical protein VJQ25_05025, partial [Nitrospira sp.]|nr:hypothetical protein [Nitrospira sp.]
FPKPRVVRSIRIGGTNLFPNSEAGFRCFQLTVPLSLRTLRFRFLSGLSLRATGFERHGGLELL